VDELDARALKYLMKAGRATWSELSGILGLSSPSTADRVRRLEETGVIKHYTAVVEPNLVGCGLMSFISVTLEHPKYRASFLDCVIKLPEIQECHHVTGDYDYLLKVRCASTAALETIINDRLKSVAGVARTTTIVALSTVKETMELPIQENNI
jgi:Lrp/AsnC family leucine-responsive transcriptional regulator